MVSPGYPETYSEANSGLTREFDNAGCKIK